MAVATRVTAEPPSGPGKPSPWPRLEQGAGSSRAGSRLRAPPWSATESAQARLAKLAERACGRSERAGPVGEGEPLASRKSTCTRTQSLGSKKRWDGAEHACPQPQNYERPFCTGTEMLVAGFRARAMDRAVPSQPETEPLPVKFTRQPRLSRRKHGTGRQANGKQEEKRWKKEIS